MILFPSVVSHLKCIHGRSQDRTKKIFRSQHRDEAPSSILYQSYGYYYSQELVLSRRGDGCRNCLLITEHMNTINTRVIAITKSIQMLIADTIQNLQIKTTFSKLNFFGLLNKVPIVILSKLQNCAD